MQLRRVAEPLITEADPWNEDHLMRKPEGEQLTRLIQSLSGSYVIAVSGKWGSGKSVFLRRFSKHLELNSIPVLSIDAWRTDYLADPLLAFVSAARVRLEEKCPPSTVSKLVSRIAEHGAVLTQPVASALAMLFAPGAAPAVAAASEAVSVAGKHLLEWEKKRRDANESFRELLVDVRNKLTDQDPTRPVKPIVIMIDELDRCRPDYAISVLERIKHYFDLNGLVFVIATDGENLPRAVSSVYGDKIDGELYLRKFFDYEFHLTEPTPKQFIRILDDQFDFAWLMASSPGGSAALETAHINADHSYRERVAAVQRGLDAYEMLEAFPIFAEAMNLTLRDQAQAFSVINAYLRSVPKGEVIFPAAFTFSICLKFWNRSAFDDLRLSRTSLGALIDKQGHEWLNSTRFGMDVRVFGIAANDENPLPYLQRAAQSESNHLLATAALRTHSRLRRWDGQSLKSYLPTSMRLANAFMHEDKSEEVPAKP